MRSLNATTESRARSWFGVGADPLAEDHVRVGDADDPRLPARPPRAAARRSRSRSPRSACDARRRRTAIGSAARAHARHVVAADRDGDQPDPAAVRAQEALRGGDLRRARVVAAARARAAADARCGSSSDAVVSPPQPKLTSLKSVAALARERRGPGRRSRCACCGPRSGARPGSRSRRSRRARRRAALRLGAGVRPGGRGSAAAAARRRSGCGSRASRSCRVARARASYASRLAASPCSSASLLAFVSALMSVLGFLLKHRGAVAAPAVEWRRPVGEHDRAVPLAGLHARLRRRDDVVGLPRRRARARADLASCSR